jgi:hypothetical protein
MSTAMELIYHFGKSNTQKLVLLAYKELELLRRGV